MPTSRRNSYPIPGTTPERETRKNVSERMVKYRNEETTIKVDAPGDRYSAFPSKYVSPVGWHGNNALVVRTSSGNTYVLGDGLIINTRDRTYQETPDDIDDDVVVGELLRYNSGNTSRVTEIEMMYKIGGLTREGQDVVDQDGPYAQYGDLLLRCAGDAYERARRDPQ